MGASLASLAEAQRRQRCSASSLLALALEVALKEAASLSVVAPVEAMMEVGVVGVAVGVGASVLPGSRQSTTLNLPAWRSLDSDSLVLRICGGAKREEDRSL